VAIKTFVISIIVITTVLALFAFPMNFLAGCLIVFAASMAAIRVMFHGVDEEGAP